MRRGASVGVKPKVIDRRYLRRDEANRLIDATGRRGRYPFRDKVLLPLVYTACERQKHAHCVGRRSISIKASSHVKRVKGSLDSTHAPNGPGRAA